MTSISQKSRVLLATGNYTSVADLQSGDLVLNMRNESVQVTKISRVDLPAQVYCIRHQNWYEPFYCSASTKILRERILADQLSETSWTTAEQLKVDDRLTSEVNIYSSLLPDVFADDSIQPSVELGTLIGLYAGYGDVTDRQVVFTFGPNAELLNHVRNLLVKCFNVVSISNTEVKNYTITVSEPLVVDFFSEFGDRLNRHVPEKYWSRNQDYLRGLFMGLIDYDSRQGVSRYIPVSRAMAEFFVMVCSVLNITFTNDTPTPTPVQSKTVLPVFPLFVSDQQPDDTHLGKITDLQVIDALELDMYQVETDDPSTGFIVNGLVINCL